MYPFNTNSLCGRRKNRTERKREQTFWIFPLLDCLLEVLWFQRHKESLSDSPKFGGKFLWGKSPCWQLRLTINPPFSACCTANCHVSPCWSMQMFLSDGGCNSKLSKQWLAGERDSRLLAKNCSWSRGLRVGGLAGKEHSDLEGLKIHLRNWRGRWCWSELMLRNLHVWFLQMCCQMPEMSYRNAFWLVMDPWPKC